MLLPCQTSLTKDPGQRPRRRPEISYTEGRRSHAELSADLVIHTSLSYYTLFTSRMAPAWLLVFSFSFPPAHPVLLHRASRCMRPLALVRMLALSRPRQQLRGQRRDFLATSRLRSALHATCGSLHAFRVLARLSATPVGVRVGVVVGVGVGVAPVAVAVVTIVAAG